MKEKLVSIIIPAYNVAPYIKKCVSSVLNQTYQNIEILVVDDGSQDETPAIIDKMAENFINIQVIHKTNAGVSAARNVGIDAAKGDYLVFVDGDDYLAPDFVKYMVGMAEKNDADFCISSDCFVSHEQQQVHKETIKIVNAEECTALLLSPCVYVGCWNKLYSRKMLNDNGIRFNEKLFFGEGLNFIINVSQHSRNVAVGNRRVYYYRRDNENSATTSFSINKLYNGITSLDDIERKLYLDTPRIRRMLNLHCTLYRLMALVQIYSSGNKNKYKKECDKYLCYVRTNTPNILKYRDAPLYNKLMLVICTISPYLMTWLSMTKRNYSKKNSVR